MDSTREEDVLEQSDLNVSPLETDEGHLLHRATAEYARLLSDSYTVPQVAGLLDVNTSRIRQRLTGTPRTLYGIKLGKAWRIPKFLPSVNETPLSPLDWLGVGNSPGVVAELAADL